MTSRRIKEIVLSPLRFYAIWAVIAVVIVVLLSEIYTGFAGISLLAGWESLFGRWLVTGGALVVGVVVHELIHAATAMYFAGIKKTDVRIVLDRSTLTPYFVSRTPVSPAAFKVILLMPFVVLGILPYVIGLNSSNAVLALLGLFFILWSIRDLMLVFLLAEVPPGGQVNEHPAKIGLLVYAKK